MALKPQYSAQISLGHRKVDIEKWTSWPAGTRLHVHFSGLAKNPSGGQDSPLLLEYLGIRHLNLTLMIFYSI